MNSKENINSLDCVNHSLHGLDCKPHMKGFIFNNMQEVWKNVNGFEGLYQISNFGKSKRNGHKLQVDHFDENKQNNYIENLQLLTNKII